MPNADRIRAIVASVDSRAYLCTAIEEALGIEISDGAAAQICDAETVDDIVAACGAGFAKAQSSD